MSTMAILEEAKVAFDRQDYGAALDAAERVIETDVKSAKAWRLRLAALEKTGNAARAETLSLEAMRLFPNADWPLSEHAKAAAARGDTDEAMKRFAELRNRFAGSASGYAGAIKLARSTSRNALAESLLAEGLQRLPDNKQLVRLQRGLSKAKPKQSLAAEAQALFLDAPTPKAALAAILKIGRRESLRKANRALALTMFDTLHDTYPDYAQGYAAHIEFLLQSDCADAAATLAKTAWARFPDYQGVGLATVRAFSATGDFAGALSLIADIKSRFQDTPALQAVHVHVLTDSGRESEAAKIAEQAVSTWPQEAGLWREYARVATRQGDWAAALDRWLEAQRKRPDDRHIARQVEMARAQLCVTVPAEEHASLYDRFESLGGEAPGCEFGMVQREGGALSVGLLRWAAISPDNLIDALDSNLEGFGAEEQTKLIEVTEYYGLRDTRYSLFTHTFVKRADAPFDKMLVQSCRRMKFLADKLREQLSAGEKIFVYKSIAVLPDDTLSRLHDAIRRRGGRALVCLQLATEKQEPGSVRVVRPGLFTGHVAFFLNGEPTGEGNRFDIPSYNAICARVTALVSGPAGVSDPAGVSSSAGVSGPAGPMQLVGPALP